MTMPAGNRSVSRVRIVREGERKDAEGLSNLYLCLELRKSHLNTTKKITNKTDNIASFIVGAIFIIIIGILTYSIITGRQTNKESVSTTKETVQLPNEHVVQVDESLWTIAEKYYQSGYNWVDVASANSLSNPDYITVGQKLVIPDVKAKIVESGQIESAAISAPIHAQITVKQGDTLWNIAMNEYGSGYEWTEIARLNSIANPDLIYPGTVLRLQ
ncbi:MAG: Metalloendopeptidase-like protein membrane protein [Microgenomates group bacterium GW2011_GWB1_40_9]|nr:MAG: Metalloendopeptidase-like protein membrane protein [Microgenomates group bacterium GW2011_GWC1_39_12]KKR78927.1 MAG: Metalloendopeptidase-like protein membrane protein [Microgenomates group bacterium GW2011_GWB1_40_9]